MYETTYPENTAFLKNVYNYMYSTNLKNEIYENIGTKSVQPVYDVNKGIMRGFTLLYSARTGNTARTLKQLENLDRLYDIKQLQYDWNGNGSKPISEKVLSFSKIIINGILVQPQIYPTGRATVQMQYELKDRSYLEFEVFEDKIV